MVNGSVCASQSRVAVVEEVLIVARVWMGLIGSEEKEEAMREAETRDMSAKNSSSFLQPPSPVGVAGIGVSTVGGQTQSSQQVEQSSSGVVRLHSVVTRPSYVSTTSISNIFRSLSTIHRSTSALPASLLDLDVASTAGLQVIRPETHPEAFVPVPPDGGWGWLVVFAAFVTNLIIDGICVSFGIMVTDLVEHFNTAVATVMLMGSLMLGVYQIAEVSRANGVSKESQGGAGSAAAAAAALTRPVAAGLVNRYGCRAVGMGGSVLATVSMFVSAFMPTIELMLVSYGFFAGAAFGFLHLPSIICVSFYFDSRRALAIGMTSCGTPIGAMIFAPLTEVLLQVCLHPLHHQPCYLTLLRSSQYTSTPPRWGGRGRGCVRSTVVVAVALCLLVHSCGSFVASSGMPFSTPIPVDRLMNKWIIGLDMQSLGELVPLGTVKCAVRNICVRSREMYECSVKWRATIRRWGCEDVLSGVKQWLEVIPLEEHNREGSCNMRAFSVLDLYEQRYGWSNTLILFAGMLLNCMVLTALYRPLTPALLLTPMKASEAEGIKSLLQLAASENAAVVSAGAMAGGDKTSLDGATPPIVSQRDLRDQPVLEEDEEEEEEAQGKVALQKSKSDQSQPNVAEVVKDKTPQSQLEAISEGPEGEMGLVKYSGHVEQHCGCVNPPYPQTEGKEKGDMRMEGEVKPRHHRHHRRQKHRKTLRQQLQQQYAQWVQGIRRLRDSRGRSDEKKEVAGSDANAGADLDGTGGEGAASSQSSCVSTCGSSCEEDASHWDSASTSDVDDTAAKTMSGDDEMYPLKKRLCKQTICGSRRMPASQGEESGVSQREASTVEWVVSAPSLNRLGRYSTSERGWSRRWEKEQQQQQRQRQRRSVRHQNEPSERRPSRMCTRPIPRQSVVQLANASVSRRRSESVSMGALTRSYLSSLGSAMFASTTGGFGSAGGGAGSRGGAAEELADTAPVIVELPHESICVEDYARPLYRKDIFFPGSVKRQIESSAASIAAAVTSMMETSGDQIGCSQASMEMADGVRRRKVTVGTSQFGSGILFGDNVPLPPINEASVPVEGAPLDANWTGSCLMSLTRIPLPDVFEVEKESVGVGGGVVAEDETRVWDRLKSETGLNLADAPADGIYRVPRSHSMCGWWLCWETRRKQSSELATEEGEEMERFKRALVEDGGSSAQPTRFPQRARLVLVRRCVFLPKSMCDVLVTMMNLSLLKTKSFLIFCLASLIAVMGECGGGGGDCDGGVDNSVSPSCRIYVPLFFVCDLADSFGIPKSQSAYLLTVYGLRLQLTGAVFSTDCMSEISGLSPRDLKWTHAWRVAVARFTCCC
ncbi:Monocarboxylate transporter [Echinococcus granulosus]|uniref:Monocarboxylate transporter n=1 Tax=Echinococcus granulosus TaxID=6210 RepID=W6UUG1_ECHGR|nr:Monocarboxylate transporter [Echinococcus granulosus]EUB61997.1 Monocarboxylate transporter [Echinococcus granulosus]